MFRPPEPIFDATPKPVNNGWGNPWAAQPQEQWKPEWHDNIDKKKAFGTQLGKGHRPYDAALIAFDNDQKGSLWALTVWLRDPIVLEAREIAENSIKLLDKEELCVKLLKMADEKINGVFVHEMKDRTALLKLYAEIQGHIGKVNIDMSKNNFTNNEMKITFVEAEQEKHEIKTIEHRKVTDLENALPINLKLVG